MVDWLATKEQLVRTTVDAIYEGGVFKPEKPVDLEEKTRVRLVIESTPPVDDTDPTGWKTADELIGCIKDGPREPLGRDHDGHLYK